MANISLTAPTDYSTQLDQINRQRLMAQKLQEEGMSPVDTNVAPGVHISWTQGLAKALQAGLGAYQQKQLNDKQIALGQQALQGAQDWATSRPQDTPGTPGQPAVAPTEASGSMPGAFSGDMTLQQTEATPGSPEIPAVPAHQVTPEEKSAWLLKGMSNPVAAPFAAKAYGNQIDQQDFMEQLKAIQGQQAPSAIGAQRAAILTGNEPIPNGVPGQPGFGGNPKALAAQIMNSEMPDTDKQAALAQLNQQVQGAQPAPQPNALAGVSPFLMSANPRIQAIGQAQQQQQLKQMMIDAAAGRQDKSIAATGERQDKSLAAKLAAADLTPEAVDNAAENYRITGNLPTLGMGGLAVKAKILNRAAEMATEHGDDAGAVATRQIANKANAAALTQMTKQEQMIGAFEKNANANADLALSLAGAASNTGVPVITKWVQSGMKNIEGDPAISKFHAATETFINEYAKIMSGSMGNTAISDAARAHAHTLLSTAMAPEQYKAVVDTLKTEMGNRMQGFASQKQELMQGMGLNNPATAPPATVRKYNPATGKLE